MRKLQLVPLSGESVDQKVSSFRQYTDEVRQLCFDFVYVKIFCSLRPPGY